MGNTTIIAGHNLGLGDTSARLLNRNDPLGNGSLDKNQSAFVNVANGNLVIQEQDVVLTSQGDDFSLVRTYNSRGKMGGADNWGWTWSTGITLSKHADKVAGKNVDAYEIVYGDGSSRHFDYDSSRALWVATDGAGAFETLTVAVDKPKAGDTTYTVTRADQSVVAFDKSFALQSIVDTNGVRMDYDYQGGRLVRIRDDSGYAINMTYTTSMVGTVSTTVLDNMANASGVTLVKYGWTAGKLTSVTDRYGQVTTYTYDANKLLDSITLPDRQTVNGQVQIFDQRRIQFSYQAVTWSDTPHVKSTLDNGPAFVLADMTDATGAKTSFEYNFKFGSTIAADDRDTRYQYSAKTFLQSGITRVVDALGNARATSNDAEVVAWRQAKGYYATYNAATVAANATLKAQYTAIRNAQSVSYQYDADGYLTGVTDEQGFQTTYAYDPRDNLTAVVDRNGYGVTNSDSSYYRLLRKDLGYVDAGGNGKLARDLSAAEKTALLSRYTTRYTYDSLGNMLSATDNAGNRTSWTYTAFNKLASQTSAVGNALATSDDAVSQQKRVELGYPAALVNLSAAQKSALLALYTTSWQYDARQNLISRTEPGGDLTRFEYDVYGNLTRRIVFLDKNDLVTASKQQVTVYAYDAYGNNTSIRDAEGYLSTYQYDPFGNLLRAVDGRGNVSTYIYDADNRLLAATDAESHTTAYAYDAVGNTIAVTDANGHTVTRIYDRANRLLSVYDPAGSGAAQDRRTQFRYDVLGNQTQVSDAEGRVTRYRFDERRQVVEIATPQVLKINADGSETLAGYSSTLAYDGENNVITLTDNNGNITQQLYTTNGLQKRLTDPTGNVTEYLYDANLNRLQITVGVQLPAGQRRVLRFGYDQKNRKARAVDALGAQMLYAYDASDNVIAVTDENGNTTNYGYDRNNRLLTVTRPQVTDPRTGLAARYTVLHRYDANGNEVATTDENGNTGTTTFDRDNRKVMTTDANGVKTVFAYDSRDNLTRVSMGVQAAANADGSIAITSVNDARVTSYAYDEFNQLVAMTDGVGNALLSSDLQLYQDMRAAQGLPALAAGLGAAQKSQIMQAYTERYGYDRVGNLTGKTDHLGRITQTAYDALDRVTSVNEAAGLAEQRVTGMRYDGNGNLVLQRDADGRVTTMRYDGMDRMVSMTDASNALSTTQYDNVGNRVQMQEGAGTAAARTSIWVYDLDNRVISETTGEGRNKRYEYDAVGNRLKITDGVGNATRYVYDAMNRNVRVIDPKSFETRYEYDGVGNQLTMVDARGGIQRVSYDAGNRRIVTTDREGRVARFEYDVLNHMVTQTTAAGTPDEQTSHYLYDAESNLRQVIDATGVRLASQYDAAYNQVATADSKGNITRYGFDALNRQISVTDALGQTTRYSYDAMQNRLTETDPLNRVRSFQYDAIDRLICETDALGVQTRYAYDAVGNEVTITHAANRAGQARAQSFVYDRDGLLLQKTDALGQSTRYSYDGNGNMTQATDAKGQVTRYQYDACQRVEVITDAEGYITRYAYDGNGNRVRTTDAGNNSWVTYYNSDNEADLTVDAQGHATTRKFDANGNMVEETRIATRLAGAIDPAARPALQRNTQLDQTVRYRYDKLNRVSTQTDAMGYTRSYSHDAAGNLLAETDENGNTTSYGYDSANRLVSRTDALGGVRLFIYDDAGNLVRETDPNGNTTTTVYDNENRLLVQTDALGGAVRYSYDSVGNLLTQTDTNGHTASYGYDSNNRMVREVDASGGVSTYAYDAEGNRVRSTDANGNTVTTWYDRKHRATLSIDALGFATAWQYDGMGNLRSRTLYMSAVTVPSNLAQLPTLIPSAGDQTTTWTYDRNNRLTRQVDATGGVTTYAYDMAGNQVQMTDASGNTTSTWYDRDNRAILRVDAEGNGTAWRHDAAGRMLAETRIMTAFQLPLDPAQAPPLPASAADQTTTYAYDANNRLVRQTDATGAVSGWTYDAAGNRMQATDAKGNSTRSWYDSNNREILILDALGFATASRRDAVGNVVAQTHYMTALPGSIPASGAQPAPAPSAADQTTSYAYDAGNRLVQQTDALGGVSSYAYDAAGNRVLAIDPNGNATRTWYDRDDRATLSVDALGHATAYTYDAVGNMLSQIRYMTPVTASGAARPTPQAGAADQQMQYTYDASNRQLTRTDAAGGVWRTRYDPAGNAVQTTDANGNSVATWYDRANRSVLSVDAMGYATAYSYDAAGNILVQTRYMSAVTVAGNASPVPVASAADQTVRYAYDANNRLLARTDASGGVWTTAYDAVGNTVQSIDANGHASTSYYDAGNRLVLEVDATGSATSSRYDAVGNMLSEQRFMTALATPVSPAALPAPAASAADQATTYVYDAGNRRISRTDARGGIWRTAYDAAGNAVQNTDANGHVTTRWYDRDNREVLTVDALGYATTLRYDALDNVVSQTRHMTALALTLPADPALQPTPAVSAGDQTTVYGYDRNNRLVRQVDALGNVTTSSHDAVGNRVQSTDANGNVTRYAYDADNRLIRLTDALNQLTLYAYDAAGNNTAMTDANGHVTAYAYDRSNRLVRQTDALNHTTTTRWDAAGNRVGVTDANGSTTSYAYDAVNRQTEVSDALNHVTRNNYDAVGNLTRITDANGNSTVTFYDASNQAVKVRDALNQVTRNTYDAAGNRTVVTDANGHSTTYIYDAANRLVQIQDAHGNLTRYAYDAVGNRTFMTDANGHTSRSTYDAVNRRTAMTDALGNTTSYGYDAAGNQTRQTDARGYVTTSTYDAVNRLLQIQDALGNRTTYTHDAVGNRSSATDALGKVTTYVYDAVNRLLQERDPLGNSTSYAWDAVGNRTSVTDANNNTTSYAYDAVNWLSSQTDALGYQTSYRYDALGNTIETSQQLSLADASSTAVIRNRYDAANRLAATRSAAGFLRTYAYDAVGNRTGITVFDAAVSATADPALIAASNAARRSTGFAYDAANRLVSQTSALGIVTAYDYDAVGNRITIVEAQGTAAARRNTVVYDAANRVVTTTDAAGVVTRMARDALGNILRIDDDWDAAAALGQRGTVFAYDALNRVSTQTDALGFITRNSYDAVGNLVQRDSAVGVAGQARTEKFEYDANRRQTAQVNGEGERSASVYDGMGNRVALIVAPGAAAQRVLRYRYDAENRLTGQTDGNGIETRYRYDGAGNKTATIQLAAAYDSSGAAMLTYQGVSIAGQSRETRFAYDLDNRLVQVTDPLAGVTAYTLDVLGNRTKIVDALGHETRNTFDAAGRLTSNLLVGADHDGVLVTNLYDRYGNIVQAQRGYADGSDVRRTSYTYDALDRQTSITEYDLVATMTAATVFTQGFSTVFEYDAYGNQLSVSHGRYLLGEDDAGYSADKAALAFALTGAFTYDALDRQTGATDGAGNLLATTYDAHGNRLTQTTGAGTSDTRTVTFSYDKADRMTRRQTGTGAVIKMAFDAAGNQVSEATLQSGSELGSAATGDAPVWSTETYQEDGNGRVVRQTSALGVITERVIDAFGNEVETRMAAGSTDQRVLRYEFNANNDLLAEVDALGNRSVYTVDALGMRTSETDALGYTTRFYYNERNEQTATLDAQGFLVGFSRDSAGNVLTTSVYLGQYSAPASSSAPTPLAADAPRTTTNIYDSTGNLVSQTGPDQRLRTFVHDSAGKLRSITDAGNASGATARVERFGYDAAGRRTSYTRADGVVETYAYDSAGNRTTETITAYQADHTVLQTRSTTITFDADNRQTGSTFDAAGLNLTTSIAYDKAGNVISKTDAMGNVTRTRYDLGNQILSITDAATAALAQARATANTADIKAWRSANGYYDTYDAASVAADAALTAQYNSILALKTQTFSYDRVGNRTRIVDAMGYATDLGYDLDNRVILETRPGVDVYTIRDGLQGGARPTFASVYDAVGNLVETTNANGSRTSYWYDGNHQQIAELNGDNVFRSFSYDAAGLLTSASLYMTRLDDSARAPATLPTAPTGEKRTVTNAYDAAGRLTKTTYPQITVTSLSGASGASPSATTASVQPEETVGYDAFGNRARSVDRNGNAAWNWYDSQDRIVASVDEAGYLTEFAYDDQGNVVRQTRYATALDTAALTVGSRPAAPAGTAYVTDRVYDKANRLQSETLPTVTVYTGTGAATLSERPVTKFSYDKNGNLVRKRLAADTASETSEYTYYDAAGRQVAIVNALGVLHTIDYDANGNKVAFRRYLTPLSRTSAQLTSDTLATLLAAVSASASADQQTTYAYDAGNRQIRSTDLMGAGDSDDIVIQTWYDAAGLQTKRSDPDGYTTQTAHDALGHITQTVSPDGNRAFIEYDAAGLQTLAWTGDLGTNAASAATGVTASIGDALAISWSTSGRGLTTWVVWDTVAHDKPADYASTSAKQSGGSASTELSLAGVAAGAKVYFRVVTVDAAGSSAWTAESSITVPVLMSSVSIATGTTGLAVTVVFNGAATTPQLKYGATGSATLASTVNFVLQSGNTWKATIASPAGGGQGLSWQLAWTANGSSYTTAATPFDAPGVHAATGPVNKWTVGWPVPAAAQGTSQLVLLGGARIDNAFQVNGQLQFDPGSIGANSSRVVQVFYGNAASTAHTATVSWSQLQKQSFSAGQPTTAVVGANTFYDTTWNVSWINDSSSALKTSVSTTLASAESAMVNASGVRVAYRTAGSGATFGTDAALAKSGNTYSADLTLTAGASYDLKFFYIDTSGNEVIIEWRTVSVPAAPSSSAASPATVVTRSSSATAPTQPTPASPRTISVGSAQTFGGKSLTVLGRETDGSLSRGSGNALSVDAGLYSGPVDPGAAAFSVVPVATTSAGAGTLQASGLTASTYYTEFLYDAIGNKVATNENTGLWRRYGVDAMGNAVKTSVYGAKADETAGSSAVVTYAAYDARGLEVARFGAAVFNDSNGDGVDDATAARAVTRSSYDYDKRKISQTDPGNSAASAQTYTYDGIGQLIAQKDALGNTTTIYYDRRGHEVRRVDALGHEAKSQYDLYGRKTSDTDGLGNVTSYGYDAFDRMTRLTDARGNISTLEYDQHDRLVKVSDALANVTQYSYDKRDNRTWTRDANDNFFGVAYDEMRRVSARYGFQGGAPTSFADAADAVTNSANAAHAFLVAETTGYDVYGNKMLEVDAEKRQKVYSYGAFGRLATQTDEASRVTSYTYDRFGRLTAEARPDDDTTTGAKAITRTYDDAGRLKSVTDATTSVSTSYTYTAAGLRAHETVRAPGLASASAVATVRNIGYTYDAAGQMTLWTDAATSTNLAYSYDAAGNLSRVWSSDNVVDHRYSYDAANRLTAKMQGTTTTLEAYTYDAYGNRATFNNGSNTATYTWNAANRVTQAVTTPNGTTGDASDDTKASWSYDKVGNVTRYEEFDKNAASVYIQTSAFNQSYRTLTSTITNRRDAASISITSTEYTQDKSGRLSKEVTTDTSSASNVYTYTHAYTLDGRELSVTASGTGSLNGSSTSTYDANDKLSRIDLGTPDGADTSASYKLFRYSNDGQVLTGFYDNGVAADKDVTTNYLYANGNIVGQKGNSTSSDTVATLLDEKAYSLFDTIGADHPASALSSYEVQAGDTLQSIAARQYGNPSLWYAIADTNDLTGSESLKPGTRLMLPNTTETGRLTADNHVVYNESSIIGSRLPNLKAPPPPEPDKCAQAAAIILTILVSIVAVVVTVLTAGALAPLAIAAAGVTATSAAGIIIGATVGAVVGATIGLASGAINQGIKIGLKVQTEFNWKEVAADVAAGAIGGVGAAFSGVAQASIKAAVAAQELSVNLGRLARVATVLMDSAINVAGEAASQAITYNGRIEEPWMLGVAGGAGIIGEVLKPLGSRAWRAIKPTALGRALRSAGSAIKSGAGKVFRFSDSAGRIVSGTADGVTSASDNGVAATLRKSDVQLASGIGGKQELKVRFADDALAGNMRTSAYTPVSWNDTAASTLSRVQSQSTLDQVADLAPLVSTKKMLAGETSGFDHATVSDFAQGSVGKVRDNSIPVSQLDTGTRSSARLSQALSSDDQWSRDIDALLADLDNATPANASVNRPKLDDDFNARLDDSVDKLLGDIDDIAQPRASVIADTDDTPDLHVPTQDAAPARTDLPAPQTERRRGRALGQAETSLPEPSLDLRETIAQSRVDRAFDFNMIDGDPKQARKALEDYFATNDITLSKSPAKLARQVQEERAYLKALKPRGLVGKRELDLQLNAFDQKVSAYEISRSSQTRKLLSAYQDLRSRPLASSLGGRNQQFLDIDDSLSQVLGDPKLSQATRLLVKNEMQLIRDTVSDAQIMQSAYVLNPSHAMELKRLGLQASAAGRVGEFTDVRLTGNMTKLGSGNLNTVYIGNYTLPDGGGAYKGVFKPEVRQWTDAPTSGVYLGIDPMNPRAGYRNVATTRLDEALGFNLITRSEMAIHNNELGTVSELALGVSPKAGKMKSNEIVPDEVIAAYASTGKPGAPLKDDWVGDYNATRGEGRMIYQETVDGRARYVYEGTAVHDINYEDPRLRRDLVRLHLMDAISGQVDRHHGNYFVLTDHAGKVVDVKAIDNDLSWGNNLKMVEVFDTGWHTRPEDAIHLPKYLPPVVDKEAYDAVMALNRQSLSKRMGGLLNGDEVDAAAQRLRLVQNHLKTLETQGRVLASRDEWASPQVTRLLMERKEGRVTNYIARESNTIEKARGKGVLLAYPQNRMVAPA